MKTNGKINRRTFLTIAGGTVAASALCCGGIGVAGMSRPAVAYVDEQFGEVSPVGKKVLVAYASKYGSTGEIAAAIGKRLAQAGALVDVRQVREVKDVQGYQALVIGSAVHMGSLLPEAVRFAETQQAALASLPAAYFTACLTMCADTPASREETAAHLQPLVDVRAPSAPLGMFAGKLDYAKLEWLVRIMAQNDASGRLSEGDWRNWQAIDDWAGSIAPQLGL